MPVPTYDMSAPVSERQQPRRYVDYLNAYTRRLKKGAAAPPADGAGLLTGSRYRGRATPLRGKGAPPAEGVEGAPLHAGGLRMVPGKSGALTDALMTRRAATAEDLAFRPSVRPFKTAFESSMVGAGAVVVEDEPPKRAMRKHGAAAPPEGVDHTRRRVHAPSFEFDGSYEWWEKARPSSVRTWMLASASANTGSILRHRMSDPDTVAEPTKIDFTRLPAPPLEPVRPEAARAVYTVAVDSFAAIRSRAIFGSTFQIA